MELLCSCVLLSRAALLSSPFAVTRAVLASALSLAVYCVFCLTLSSQLPLSLSTQQPTTHSSILAQTTLNPHFLSRHKLIVYSACTHSNKNTCMYCAYILVIVSDARYKRCGPMVLRIRSLLYSEHLEINSVCEQYVCTKFHLHLSNTSCL